MKTTNPYWPVIAVLLLTCSIVPLPGATFTVTKTADSGSGTLRQAILDANTNGDLDTIVFNITMGGGGLKTITPTTALPVIIHPVIIDGTTQPGYANTPVIELNGASAGAAVGLDLRGGNSTIRALTINRFHFQGIVIMTNGNNVIERCFIGTDSTGTLVRGNGIPSISDGIAIFSSPGNLIGGPDPFAGNVISGNGRSGIGLLDSLSRSNRVEANAIGTDVTGMAAVPNREGIGIQGAPGNTIGGANAFFANLISGNTLQGIAIVGGNAVGNAVESNKIGLDATGQAALPNGSAGILISTTTLPAFPGPASATRIGGNGAGNIISGNGHHGIEMGFGTTSNLVIGNSIGLSEDGLVVVANGRHGVGIFDSSNNIIGGGIAERNFIVGNFSNGVHIARGNLNSTSVSNVVRGNTIAENGLDGVQLSGGAHANRILGNVIGAGEGIDGLPLIGNWRHGVSILDSTNNLIGGAAVNERNYISGNLSNGVFLGVGALGSGSVSNSLRGNRIGTTPVGNGGVGVFVSGHWNFIGGTNAGEGNVIAYNGSALQQRGHGVVIAEGEHNPILGNLIWTNSGRGIDLGNDSFTVNDIQDGDTGANDLQNYPVVTRVAFYRSYGLKEITWTLNTKTNRPYRIEFFGNSLPDASGFGEGQRFFAGAEFTTDANGIFEHTSQFPISDQYIAFTVTDLVDMNTSEFSPVDTDGDAIADAWEMTGIDYDEDGTNDLKLAGANWRRKDIYVEIDAMSGRAPDPNLLAGVNLGTVDEHGRDNNDGFFNAPAELVQNPNGKPGIFVHMELDETNLPLSPWTNNPSAPMLLFDILKSNYFGTLEQFTNANALKAKQLVYHYCIFADDHPNHAGRARDFLANDFYLVLGTKSSSRDDLSVPKSFMHELGHCLGLKHGGADHDNHKPNYHSVMNYSWGSRLNSPFTLDFSRTDKFATLNETNLNESIGIGGPPDHNNHTVVVGPHLIGTNKVATLRVPEFGPVDWNGNGTSNDVSVIRDLNYLPGEDPLLGDTLRPSEDWSRLRYYFLDARKSAPQFLDLLTNDLDPRIMEELEKLGAGVGRFQFNPGRYNLSETGGVAVVSVTRIFEAEGTVSVSFTTANETATSGVDYVATNGVLTFTGSEEIKTFAIPILNDGVAEEPETIRLVLSNPTGGATLGQPIQATLTIVDEDPPGHFTVGNTNNSGIGSLRQAILDANASSGLGIIEFNIPGSSGLTISLNSALPAITGKITIDGTTQPGFAGAPIIELNGTSAGANADGLQITGGHCTVRGLVINRFSRIGINLLGSGQNRIEGCYIGLNRQGTLDQGNASDGIAVQCRNNVIGGSTAAARNFISGNNASGIIFGGASATNNQVRGNVIGLGVDGSDQGNSQVGVNISTSWNTIGGGEEGEGNVISGNNTDGVAISGGVENKVLGNFIGTDLPGTAARSNNAHGIQISTGSPGQIIGGDDPSVGNVISGNGLRGIFLSGATGTRVLGNRIGTDVTGQNPIPNQQGGIVLSAAGGCQIGGTALSEGNTIAFNNGPGVFVSSGLNNAIRGNAIFSNSSSSPFSDFSLGIDLGSQGLTVNDPNDSDVGANQLQNYPQLTSASNTLAGTFITGSLNSRPSTNFTIDFYANAATDPSGFGEGQSWIGSTDVTTDGSGNVTFTASTPAIYLKGNHITATATDAAGNTSEFSSPVASASTIPGQTFTVVNTNDSGEGSLRQAILDANANISERDTIEFDIPGFNVHTIRPLSPLPFLTDPVLIDGYTQPGSSANTASTGHNGVLLIELDGSLAGATHGLRIEAGNSIVRGLVINRFATGGADENNLPGGILLMGGGGNRIEGNLIGTDPTGFVDRGNTGRGIAIFRSSSNVIGGTAPADRNVISGNDVNPGFVSGEAVYLYGDDFFPSSGNRVEGNLLGTAANGVTPLGNMGRGVRFYFPTNTTIGGTMPGAGNVIAFNAAAESDQNACGVDGPINHGPRGIAILGNSIYSNFGPGIGGNRVNSPAGRGNFPLLSSAMSSNGMTTIQGHLNSVSNASHRIEFFANDTFDSSGHGEGKIFLGATNVPTDPNGLTVFTALLPVTVSNSMFIAATATDDRNNTSEFSPRLRVGDVLTNVIVVNSVNDVDDGMANTNHTSLREAILAANNHLGPDTIRFAIGTGARTIILTNILPALLDAGTTIDATTQPGFTSQPLIFLNGFLLTPSGFRLYAPSNTIRGFVINGFGFGIVAEGAFSSPFGGFNVIEGNYLGNNDGGTGGIASQDFGIYLNSGCPSNRIGGANAAARNVISGNNRAGVYAFDSPGNTFAGNFVGTDRTGTNVVGNGILSFSPLGGLFLQRCPGTVIGGNAPGSGNLISANASLFSAQVLLADDCSGSVVQGNFIGTDVTGRTNVGNTSKSIDVLSLGPVLIKSNLLCGTLALESSSNVVQGNFIGSDVTGTRAILVPSSILIGPSANANVIGGTDPGTRNLISGGTNLFFGGGAGLRIQGASNVVQGNFIGTQIDGVSPIGNIAGVTVESSFNLIGGQIGPAANIVAFTAGAGISVTSGTSNALLGNSIFSNTGLGIDLGTSGVTTNDAGDLDAGANNLQNFPLLSAARNIGSGTIFQGTLNSRSNTSYRIEFFSNTNCHTSGFGQGRTFLNATTATTDSSGNAPIFFQHPSPIPAGQFITATATDPNNNTSEFSPCVTVINDTNYVVLSFTTFNPYTLSWPTSASNFLLERATNLTPPVSWQMITNGVTTNVGSKVFFVTNDLASPAQFFRLKQP